MQFNLFSIFYLLLLNYCKSAEDDLKIVTSIDGLVKGKEFRTILENKTYYAFKGIPYAEAPINELRFKEPIQLEPIKDNLDAFEFGNVCLQLTSNKGNSIGNEDCLFLNIYTPDICRLTKSNKEVTVIRKKFETKIWKFGNIRIFNAVYNMHYEIWKLKIQFCVLIYLTRNAKLSVMFFIHGGGFRSGSGNDIGPDFLIDEGVLVVTINYRLGIFGFMSLGNQEYPGNMGLKDQLLALKWVNENIHNFGGNNNSITIFGHSAGAAIVHYNVISPIVQGLFQRAIIMSGSCLNTWAFNTSQSNIDDIYTYARQKDETITTYQDLVRFLHTIDAHIITKDTLSIEYAPDAETKKIDLKWIPILETANNKFTFINEKPWKLAISIHSNVDTMFGFTSKEALFLLKSEIQNQHQFSPFNEVHDFKYPLNNPDIKIGSKKYVELNQRVRNFYFGQKGTTDKNTIDGYIDFISDIFIGYGVHQAVRIQARRTTGKTYYYKFAVDAKLNIYKNLMNVTSLKGASHVDELYYLFRLNSKPKLYDNLEVGSIEWNTIKIMSQMWASFAKYGTPQTEIQTIDFKPIENGIINYLNIGNDGLTLDVNPNTLNYKFWDDLYNEAAAGLDND